MKKHEELDNMLDYLRAGVSIHPDTLKQYQQCMKCGMGNDCQSCSYSDGLDAVLCAYLRPRPPMPSLC